MRMLLALFLACRSTPPLPVQPETGPFIEHLRETRYKAPPGFTVVAESPWVVVGDEPEARVRRRAEQTVRTTTAALRSMYGFDDPDQIWTIWLFQDAESYRYFADMLFGEQPSTPYGYASRAHHGLVMDISTGGGTLVHEMVHPMLHASFPEVPPWFNEGLASLYEQVSVSEGRLVGHVNWRLPGLQAAIQKGELLSFEALMALDEAAFYGADPGFYYGQSRYLCYYLQEKELLQKYYETFRRNRHTDPTGIQTLAQVLKRDDLSAFQVEWEAYVLDLK